MITTSSAYPKRSVKKNTNIKLIRSIITSSITTL